tara:strand:- start:1137 stop:1310 length:174 start_codon:yes stop_codon:yes gene_type:complete
MISDQILSDLAEAYSPEQIIELLDLEPIDLLQAFVDRVQENITKFEIRPVDCNDLQL